MHLVIANSTRVLAGAERFVRDAAHGLTRRGWRVTVLGYPGSPLLEAAAAEGLPTWAARTRADSAPWTVLPLAAALARRRADVLLTCYEKDLRTVGWAARVARRPIRIVHSRECDTPLKPRLHYRLHYQKVPDLILANSEATRQTTLRSAPWLDPARVRVVPKAVDPDRFFPRPIPSPGVPRIGFAGQLVPRKRVDSLLEGLVRLTDREWTLEIAGSGPEELTLRRLAGATLPGRVTFHGQVDDMPAWLASLDLLVLPSVVEGFGYVLAEAMAIGRPVVAMRSSSAPEVVRDGQTGRLADPADPRGLSDAIAWLLDDPARRRRLGQAAAEDARERFALPLMLDRLEDALAGSTPALEAHP